MNTDFVAFLIVYLFLLTLSRHRLVDAWNWLKGSVPIVKDCKVLHETAVLEIDIWGSVLSDSIFEHIAECKKYRIEGKKVLVNNHVNELVRGTPKALRHHQIPTMPSGICRCTACTRLSPNARSGN